MQGFTGVTDIAGGFAAWSQNELPVDAWYSTANIRVNSQICRVKSALLLYVVYVEVEDLVGHVHTYSNCKRNTTSSSSDNQYKPTR